MPDAIDNLFGDMDDDRYPGSRHSRRPATLRPEEEPWDFRPIIKTVRGVRWELFTIGHLGNALGGRAAVTMRLWERQGVLPKARIRLAPKNGKGGRRYYTREQVEGLQAIAGQLGMLTPRAAIDKRFAPAAMELFRSLEQKKEEPDAADPQA